MNRRRALMSVGGGEVNHLLYSLYNHQTVAGDYIGTGVPAFAAGKDLTVLFDMTLTANPTSGTGRVWQLLQCYNTEAQKVELEIGKNNAAANQFTVKWMETNNALGGTNTTANRKRIAVRHSADSNDIIIWCKTGTSSIVKVTATATFISTTGQLRFGHNSWSDGRLPPGTITKAEVYDIVLDDSELTSFFS